MLTPKLIIGSLATMVFPVSTYAGSVELADLHTDFSQALSGTPAPVAGTSIFTENNWRALSGINGPALVFDPAIAPTLNEPDVPGYSTAGGEGILEIPHLSEDGVFDGLSANPGELGLHPGRRGPAGDLHLTWTAPQAYDVIDVDYRFRRGMSSGGTVGLFIDLNDTGLVDGFDFIDGGVSTTTITGTVSYSGIQAGDVINIAVFAAGGPGAGFAGDQSFGNFQISTIPSPTTAAFGLFGLLALTTRRRRSQAVSR